MKRIIAVSGLLVFSIFWGECVFAGPGDKSRSEKKFEELLFGGDQEVVPEQGTRRVKLLESLKDELERIATFVAAPFDAQNMERPVSPTVNLNPDNMEGYDGASPEKTSMIRACEIEARLGLRPSFVERLRKAFRARPINSDLKGALIYDDGSVDVTRCDDAFNANFELNDEREKTPVDFHLINRYSCDYGNHATAVTATLMQACPSLYVPILVVGGDGKKGNYSEGQGIDSQFVKDLKEDLRKKVLQKYVVLNASYGSDTRGDSKSVLDEGGLWNDFWTYNQNSVVVQAAGNESKDLSVTDAALQANKGLESAYNMLHVYHNPTLHDRFIHAMASIPHFDKAKGHKPQMAMSFTNYYSFEPTSFVSFARDHALMAPGQYVFIPLDPFDADNDGTIYEAPDVMHEWSGTSAAAPMISGAILRLVNEFGITAQQAAALLLETADFAETTGVDGPLKAMNLGAAMVEAWQRQMMQKVKGADKFVTYTDILDTYFNDHAKPMRRHENNFLFDMAARMGVLELVQQGSKSVGNKVYDWTRTQVKPGSYQSNTPYHQRKSGGRIKIYGFYAKDEAVLSSIAVDVMDGRTVDFRLTYTAPRSKPVIKDFLIKGILDAKITNVLEVGESNGKEWIVSVTVPDYFTSHRMLILLVPDVHIMGLQDNRVMFNGKEFMLPVM